MRSLRIILLVIEPPLPFGHASARWFYVLLRGLVARGHRVTMFATCSKQTDMERARQMFPPPEYDLRLYLTGRSSGIGGKWRTLRQPNSYLFSPELLNDLQAECAKGYDLLHLEHIWSGWPAWNTDRGKAILNFHNLYAIDDDVPTVGMTQRLHRRLRLRGEQRLLRAYPNLMTLSDRLKRRAELIAPQSRIRVVPLG